jgi:hypothetical protein
MKLKNFLVVGAIALLAACETPYRATDTTLVVPTETQTVFTTQYPGATNVVWTNYDVNMVPIDWELAGWTAIDDDDYLVRFDMDNEKYYAWYDSDGNWIGTAYVVADYKSLPASVHTTLGSQFPSYTISSVNREFHKDRVAYEIEMKNGDSKVKLLVDANGNIIKQKTKTVQ